MKWVIAGLLVFVTLQFIVGAYVDIAMSARITQLECARAQAHAEADTLEAMLKEGD